MSVLLDELGSSFVPYATHSRHVVGRVTNQGQVVGDKFRRDPKALVRIFNSDPMLVDIGRPAATRVEKPDSGLHQLLKVLVPRHHHYIHTRVYALRDQCSYNIISLISGKRQNRNMIGVQHLAYAIHSTIEIRLELFGKLFASCLVRRIALMSKGKARVVYPTEIFRLMLGDEPLEEVGDAPAC